MVKIAMAIMSSMRVKPRLGPGGVLGGHGVLLGRYSKPGGVVKTLPDLKRV